MKKLTLCTLLITCALSGCSAVNTELETKEKLLVGSGNDQQLIEFYKANLKLEPIYKAKLVNLYLTQKDIKSAELYRNTYSESDLDQPEFILTNARLDYQKKNYAQALENLDLYLDEGGEEGQFHLLKGKILAQQKRFPAAIEQFEESRKQGASDREAGNNIAVVKMMQSDYLGATDTLYDLYLASPSDKKVRSNLIISSVNADRPDIALEVLRHTNSDEQARKQLAALMRSIKKNKRSESSMRQSTAKTSFNSMGAGASFVAPTTKVSRLATDNEFQQAKNSLDGSELDLNKLKPGVLPVYRVQVLATYTAIPSDFLNYLKTNYGTVYSYTHGLWKRYCIGEFNDLDEAKTFLSRLNIKGAFVVDYTKKRYVRL
ncbi:tetratricopeptide repeat protein [Vibrio europaeus]|uniref:tetratricopeptide repeat protein n=1 Tax=Vibrio europaeus TaxID=300876 RepID=UPI00234245B7|nr:tetratricopeptide repeat protein [Vibrio europaeus]MDC5842347.1 tetratricopeptide repeat protein [Vibrio europaeus]